MRQTAARPQRLSRVLIAVLALVFVVGLIAYFHNSSRVPTAADDSTPQPSPAVAAVSSPAPTFLAASSTTPLASPVGSVEKPAPPVARASTAPSTSPAAAAPVVPSGTFADGKAKIDAGDLVAGRKILNEFLAAGQLNGPDTAAAKSLISQANQTLIFSPKRFKDDPCSSTYTVPPGGALVRIAYSHNVTGDFLCRINGIADARRLRSGQQIKMIDGPFHAVVSKGAFTLDLYLGAPGGPGSTYITTFPVGLGKNDSTPVGTWIVEPKKKLKDPVYYPPPEHGGKPIAAGDPANPLGKFWIALKGTEGQAVGKSSYGIHGNIDPTSIGKMESMGCIRMRNEDIPLVYEMLIEGKSLVVVKD